MAKRLELEQTAFLSGGNGAFIEELYARYLAIRARSTRAGAAISTSSGRRPGRCSSRAARALQPRAGRAAGRRRSGASTAARWSTSAASARAGRSSTTCACDADPRLPGARPSGGRSRSARASPATSTIPSSTPRPTASPRPTSTASSSSTTCSASRRRRSARDRRDPARDLLRQDRRRVHAHPGSRPEGLDPGPHRGQPQPAAADRRDKQEILEQLVDRRDLRALPRRQVPRHQALRPRRRRERDAGARGDHPPLGRARRRRDRDRHAASRPAQRAGQRHGQALRRDLLRVPGRRGRPTTCWARATSSTTSAPRPTASCRTAARSTSA